jgi:hypothetical protein
MMKTTSNNRTIFEGQNCPTRGMLLKLYPSPQRVRPPTISSMGLTAIVQSIDEKIVRLEKIRAALLTDHTAPLKRTARKRKASEEGRARMAAAQKARWAKIKK